MEIKIPFHIQNLLTEDSVVSFVEESELFVDTTLLIHNNGKNVARDHQEVCVCFRKVTGDIPSGRLVYGSDSIVMLTTCFTISPCVTYIVFFEYIHFVSHLYQPLPNTSCLCVHHLTPKIINIGNKIRFTLTTLHSVLNTSSRVEGEHAMRATGDACIKQVQEWIHLIDHSTLPSMHPTNIIMTIIIFQIIFHIIFHR